MCHHSTLKPNRTGRIMREEKRFSDVAACPADSKSKQTVLLLKSGGSLLRISSWEVSTAAMKLKEALLPPFHRLWLQVN